MNHPARRTLTVLLALSLAVALGTSPARTQVTPRAIDEGATGLGLALRRLPVDGRVLYVTAHPDDENNGVLVALSRGRGLTTSLLTTTRGDGGQNEIGPELFQAIGILRGEELMAVHRFDGVAQYHTRAYEFGYSFSVEETLQKWGHDEILGDMVRVIRRVRPDVILTMNREGTGGGQHHQTSARLAAEAFRAAADPARYPEQLAEGLRPWQAQRIFESAAGGPASTQAGAALDTNVVQVKTGEFDPLLGMTWEQFGQIARANHKCQGTSQLEAFPTDSAGRYRLVDTVSPIGDASDPMSGIDVSLARLAALAAGHEAAMPTLAADLAEVSADARAALDAFDATAPARAVPSLVSGLVHARRLRQAIDSSALPVAARDELASRLRDKEDQFQDALRLASGLVVRVTSRDGDVVRGQTLDVTAQVFNVGTAPITLDHVSLNVPAGWTVTPKSGETGSLAPKQSASIVFAVTVGAEARYSQPYWKVHPGVDRYDIEVPADQTLPWSPPAITATVTYGVGGATASVSAPAYYRYDGPWVGGEKQKIVNVVPAMSVAMTPGITVVPLAAGGRAKEFRVAVRNYAPSGGDVTVRLDAPTGWTVRPASARVPFSVENEEMSVQFFVTPPARLLPGAATLGAVATRDGAEFREGVQVIAYDHIQERHLLNPAESTIKLIDVTLPAGLRVGYVMGPGDETAAAIEQLGATVDRLTPSDVAFGDLSRYQTIVLGIRAYEARADVRGYHQRLMDYVKNGGRLVVQYNKVAMNQLGAGAAGVSAGGFRGGGAATASPYVPYPGGITSNRVTVEEAPVRILDPRAPMLTSPNRITPADFDGWVQERGLYFFGAQDPRYTDLLASRDPWPYNPGEKLGLLTTAKVGKGTWTYVGLGLWRQLPAGTPGAYRLLANLLVN
jgi:LmbE family N-acetylglucosaminyl deacetylase